MSSLVSVIALKSILFYRVNILILTDCLRRKREAPFSQERLSFMLVHQYNNHFIVGKYPRDLQFTYLAVLKLQTVDQALVPFVFVAFTRQ
jgi:hypothetical protein